MSAEDQIHTLNPFLTYVQGGSNISAEDQIHTQNSFLTYVQGGSNMTGTDFFL